MNALEVIFGPRSRPSRRLEGLLKRLQAFDYKIIVDPGKQMIADVFSRLCDGNLNLEEESKTEIFLAAITEYQCTDAVTLEELREANIKDEVTQRVLTALESGIWDKDDNQYNPYRQNKDEFYEVNGILMRVDRIVIPESLKARILEVAHKGCPGITRMTTKLRDRF